MCSDIISFPIQNVYDGLEAFPVESHRASPCVICDKTSADGLAAASAPGGCDTTHGTIRTALGIPWTRKAPSSAEGYPSFLATWAVVWVKGSLEVQQRLDLREQEGFRSNQSHIRCFARQREAGGAVV